MIVISDTSPLIVLANLGALDVLPSLFGSVLIPPAVAAELAAHSGPAQPLARNLPPWLQVAAPNRTELIGGLDPGESQAIWLCVQMGADLLLIDERDGRRAAVEQGIVVTETLGVLERAAAQDLLDPAEVFERLKETDFHASRRAPGSVPAKQPAAARMSNLWE